jgi:hypothetical protein
MAEKEETRVAMPPVEMAATEVLVDPEGTVAVEAPPIASISTYQILQMRSASTRTFCLAVDFEAAVVKGELEAMVVLEGYPVRTQPVKDQPRGCRDRLEHPALMATMTGPQDI